MTTVKVSVELKPFEFQCKNCKKVHKRGLWSIAHYDTPHSYACECGHITKNVHKKGTSNEN